MRFLDEGTFYQTSRNRRFCVRLVSAIFGVWLLSCQLGSDGLKAQTQEPCKPNALERAEEAFDRDEHQTAIALLQPCLPNGITNTAQKKRSHKLLALSYLAQGDSVAAEREVDRLIVLDGEYQPDMERDSEIFKRIVGEIKQRQEQEEESRSSKRKASKKWWWIGGGALAVGGGAAIYIITRPDRLPDPPGAPTIPPLP